MEADGLFVYGALREGGSQHTWLMRTNPAGLCRAWAPGRLFHLPSAGFPAMVAHPEPPLAPPGPGWVLGEFVGYEDSEELEQALNDLDQLKDVDGGLFERWVYPVRLQGGQNYSAWIYVFPTDRVPRLEREGVELLNGDWTHYLNN